MNNDNEVCSAMTTKKRTVENIANERASRTTSAVVGGITRIEEECSPS